jgi:hypothetical protein
MQVRMPPIAPLGAFSHRRRRGSVMVDRFPTVPQARLTAEQLAAQRARTRRLGIWVSLAVALITLGGAGYMVYLQQTTPPPPPLPAGPPHSTVILRSSSTDMLDGNFVLTTALYRSTETPSQVVAYYRGMLKAQANQVGSFAELANSTLPALAPEALQHVPPLLASPTAADSHAARYLYTEYHEGVSDIGIAVDARYAKGPTLVYQEMLTQPG